MELMNKRQRDYREKRSLMKAKEKRATKRSHCYLPLRSIRLLLYSGMNWIKRYFLEGRPHLAPGSCLRRTVRHSQRGPSFPDSPLL